MWWLMLLPSGRWNGHYRVAGNKLADVIANWQMLLPGVINVLFLSYGMLSRTSSHMCGRWYLPTFLFRDGLLTLINRASFIALVEVLILPSYNVDIFNTYTMTSDVKMVKYGGGGLLVFFEPLTKGSRGLSYIFIFTLHPSIFITVDDPTLLHHGVLIFRAHQEVLDGSPSLEVYLHTIVTAFVLDTFTQPLIVWNSYIGLGSVASAECSCSSFCFSGLDCST